MNRFITLLALFGLLLFGCSTVANFYVNHIQLRPTPDKGIVENPAPVTWLAACPKKSVCVLPYWGSPRNTTTGDLVDYTQYQWHCPEGYWYTREIGMSDTWELHPSKPIVCVKIKQLCQNKL